MKRVLLVRGLESGWKDLWHIPAGSVERGELPEDAAVREAKEEAGLDVTLTRFVNAYVGRFPDGEFVVRFAWLAVPARGQTPAPLLAEEIAEARFFTQAEFDALYAAGRVRMHHTKLMIEDARRALG